MEDRINKTLEDIGIGKDFMNKTPVAQELSQKSATGIVSN